MTSPELKVENWGFFFLQRLKTLHQKGELCDLSLKFHISKNVIKVHRLVLTACTDYFEKVPKNEKELLMPSAFKYEHVLPIINFLYTGKLTYDVGEIVQLCETAKSLNLTILEKLLNAQIKPSKPQAVIKSYGRKPTPQPVPVPSTPSTSSLNSAPEPSSLPGKKLPIWKKRTVPGPPPDDVQIIETVPKVKVELPRPTRFEWPEEVEEPPVVYNPTFDNLSYESKPMLKPVDNLTPLNVVLKGASGNSGENQCTPSFKRAGNSILLGQRRSKRLKLSEQVYDAPESDDDDDDDDDHFETHYIDDDDDDDEYLPATPTKPKPILKPLSSESPTPTPGKKVRFSFSANEGKENSKEGKDIITANTMTTPLTNISVTSEMTSKSGNSANHTKIIAEVLKKYPDLVKNKNVRLKIVSPGSLGMGNVVSPASNLNKDSTKSQAKVSYVVMKSESELRKTMKQDTPKTGAENISGPWLCVPCGTSIEPVNFDTYYAYRKHLQDIHNERIDARICEHCGLKASKRNLHLYHLYTKHNIPPPRNISFPKCDKCDYIALSESLLIKHRNNHSTTTKDYVCTICNAAFKSSGALQGHMQTNLHQDQGTKKDYECVYCGKIFNRNINLKAHVRTAHQEESRRLYDDEEKVDEPGEGAEQSEDGILQVIEVPVINSVQSHDKGQHTLLLQSGMTIIAESPTSLLPSSESESMNNVASGIATSINITDTANMVNEQTVILLDENSEFILQSTPMVLTQEGACQEYIVPEIMTSDSGQVFTTGLVNYTVDNNIYSNNIGNNVIEGENNKRSDHTYADDSTSHLSHSNGCTEVRVTDNITGGNAHHQGVIIIGTSDERGNEESQVSSEILIDDSSGTLLMDADWVRVNTINDTNIQNDSTSVKINVENQNVHVNNSNAETKKITDNLVKDWDFDDDTVEDIDDSEENDVKPSRPTIELEETIIPDNI
uniref:BTB domain-containing protein n=1 Tax=Clastoptera arizonana TaxID=38151 RepID=A0A1B6ED78_9HEMI